ncbi:MAG: ABC transporter ATP-binding protein [Planctomycetota bacterium]
MPNSEVLISAEGISKKFCRDFRKSLWYGLRDSIGELLPMTQARGSISELRSGEFWANDEISFEIKRGECVGLVGGNGAGKTTLLRILNQLIKPDRGCVTVRGQRGGLIALEAGFNPVLTGRENIFINGSILGLSQKQIRDRLERIVDFADVPTAIDAPVQTYSSGMRVRLGFAIAACLIEPDVLFLDEVLAVGDAAFRSKCYNEIARIKSRTATIFVSHNMGLVAATTTRGIVLDKGRVLFDGETHRAIEQYNVLNQSTRERGQLLLHEEIRSAELTLSSESVGYAESLEIKLKVDALRTFDDVYFDVVWYNAAGESIGQWNGFANQHRINLESGIQHLSCTVKQVCLAAGAYDLGINLRCNRTAAVLVWSYKQYRLQIENAPSGHCAYQMQ